MVGLNINCRPIILTATVLYISFSSLNSIQPTWKNNMRLILRDLLVMDYIKSSERGYELKVRKFGVGNNS